MNRWTPETIPRSRIPEVIDGREYVNADGIYYAFPLSVCLTHYGKRHIKTQLDAIRAIRCQRTRLRSFGSFDAARRYARENYRSANGQRANQANVRAKKLGCPDRITEEDVVGVFAFHGNACLRCGKKKRLAIDHVKPLSKGGANAVANLQPLCVSCNSWKREQTIDFRRQPLDLRDIVRSEMSRRGMTTYTLIQALRGRRKNGGNVPASTVYNFIRDASPINSDDLSLIFDVLKLTVKGGRPRKIPPPTDQPQPQIGDATSAG